ncbi:hypothetical protein Anas_05078 [Armadillidium nasatum]|uniref:Chitin-binding type-2 domain-containing protein n=1 Tax=Armadillidium nasatum TaxID=96803 RepID=A0A5N5TKJ6_9CRUS|nr:hypothetical protein Anas_05078 [Armadillidium nasatum]
MKRSLYILCLVIFIELLASNEVYGFEPQVGTLPDDPCIDPWTACSNISEVLKKVYDPMDCHQYYECVKNGEGDILPSNSPISCGAGQYFNYAEQNCVTEDIPCSKACINDDCPFSCSSSDGVIADPLDCGIFYICVDGKPSPATHCSEPTPYFDGTDCNEFEFKCCTSCSPYCYEVGVETEDPYDCKSYYLCETEGTPSKDSHFQCPEGYSFDKPLKSSCSTVSFFKVHLFVATLAEVNFAALHGSYHLNI